MNYLKLLTSQLLIFLASYVLCTLCVLCSEIVFASECDWVESAGEAAVENITPEEARQTAINRARISAIESKTSVRVHGSTMVKDYNLMADVVQTLSQGYIIEEKIIKWEQGSYQESADKAPLTTYRVRLKSCVAGIGEKDPYFKIEARLNKPVFIDGEEAVIAIKANRNAYLNIFNLTADDRVSLIAPSVTLPVMPVKANEEFRFPPEGFGLLMSVIKDKKRSSEIFIIVATKEPYDFVGINRKTEGLTVPEFYKAIIKIPSNAKTEEMLVYEVVAKQ